MICRLFQILAVALIAALAGCQQEAAVDRDLPAPYLGPPTVVARSPAPVAQQATASPRNSASTPASSVPAGWIPPVRAHAWRFIIVHHSATPRGSARSFDRAHRRRGWDELGYHFVIGNGIDSADGQVEIGSRWTSQKHGAHAGVEHYNEYGIGICLVGDFNIDRPTGKQMRSLAELVSFLVRQHRIPSNRVLSHRDIKATDCPGRFLSVAEVRQAASLLHK